MPSIDLEPEHYRKRKNEGIELDPRDYRYAPYKRAAWEPIFLPGGLKFIIVYLASMTFWIAYGLIGNYWLRVLIYSYFPGLKPHY